MLPVHSAFILHRATYINITFVPVGHLLAKNLNPAVCIILSCLVFSTCSVADILLFRNLNLLLFSLYVTRDHVGLKKLYFYKDGFCRGAKMVRQYNKRIGASVHQLWVKIPLRE